MKISALNPTILSSHSAEVISLFEELGFERRHHDSTQEGVAEDSIRMKDASGSYIDITTTSNFHNDVVLIRIGVDDLEEASRLLQEHGFYNVFGKGEIIEAPHWHAIHMASHSGLEIMLVQHLRKD